MGDKKSSEGVVSKEITIVITRLRSKVDATIGYAMVMVNDGSASFDSSLGWSLELPWRENQRNVSCIPPGRYEACYYESPTLGKSVRLMNVPNRFGILIHSGNTTKDTRGCILLGVGITYQNGIRLINSRKVVNDLARILRPAKGVLPKVAVLIEQAG